MTNIIQLTNAAKIHGGGDGIVAEVVTITPAVATAWLRCNHNNRPVRKKHVVFLAQEMLAGNWQVNGQAIVISDDEDVLDGQHRLMAIIESGLSVKSLVVYGISREAFKTIDTGAVRTGADALCLHFPHLNQGTVKCAATAVQWIKALEQGNIRANIKIGNTDTIAYVAQHQSILRHAETLSGYPRDARPLSLGIGVALYEMFARKDEMLAHKFMQDLYTGENLTRTDVEMVLRMAFIKDANRISKYRRETKVRMVIKGWNWRRRGMLEASPQTIAVQSNDEQRIKIL